MNDELGRIETTCISQTNSLIRAAAAVDCQDIGVTRKDVRQKRESAGKRGIQSSIDQLTGEISKLKRNENLN